MRREGGTITLRKKTILSIGTTFVLLIAIFHFISQSILRRGFASLEQENARQNVQRALNALADDLAALGAANANEKSWRDPAEMAEHRLNLILLLDASGQPYFWRGNDPAKGRILPVPEEHRAFFAKHPLLWRHADPQSKRDGLVLLPDGSPLLFSSRPLLADGDPGRVIGTSLMARLLNEPEIARIAKITQIPLALRRYDDSRLPPGFERAKTALAGAGAIYTEAEGEDTLAGYAVLSDVFGKPALLLKASDSPRRILAQAVSTSRYFLLTLILMGIAFGGTVYWVVDKAVLSRLTRLSSDVARIDEASDLSIRLATPGSDELADLAFRINSMLEGIEHSHLALQTTKGRLEGLVEASAKINSILDLETVIEAIFDESNRVLGGDRCSVYLRGQNGEAGGYLATRGLSQEFLKGLNVFEKDLPRSDVLDKGETIILRDALNDPRQAGIRHLVEQEGFRSALILPLGRRGEIFGTMAFYFDDPQDFGPERISISQAFAAQTATAIEHSRLFSEVQRRATNLEILDKIAKTVNSSLEMDALFRTAVEQVKRAIPSTGAALYAIDQERKRITDFWLLDPRETDTDEDFLEKHGDLAGSQYEVLFETRRLLYIPDTRLSPYERVRTIAQGRLRSIVTVPILEEGVCVGALSVSSQEVDAFTQEHIALLSSVVDHLGVALKNAKLFAQVRETSERLDNLVRSATDAILVIDAKGAITSWNPGAEGMYGYAEPEVLGRNVLDVLAPDETRRKELLTHRNLLVSGEVSGPIETVMHHKDGTPVEVSINLSVIRDSSGGFSGFSAIHRDIGALKRAEQALRESEERFRSLVENAGDAVFVQDLQGRYLDVNQQACESLGYTREELLNLTVSDIEENYTHEELLREWRNVRIGDSYTVEGVHRRKNGETFPVEVRLAALESREQTLILALARDITERKRAEKLLLRTEKLASIGRLTAGAAHEILNPANIIGMYAQGLIKRPDDPENVKKSGNTIYRNVQRIAKICEGLRRFSRDDVRILSRFDLAEVIQETATIMEPQLRMNKKNLLLDIPAEPLFLEADRDLITQVLVNLVNNAQDAMAEGGEVIIQARQLGDGRRSWVRIAVRDNGEGIPPDVIPRIFDPFYTTKDVAEGTGLGLSIVHGIVEDHGGRIDVQSEEGAGTTFLIDLPAQPVVVDSGTIGRQKG